MRAITLPVVSEGPGLARYLNEIKKFPLLTADEEYMLAERFREHGEAEAAHQLVTSHLRLVAKIAMQYRGYGLPVSDLISEGNIGLMKAVKKFEPERGFRLSTYAMWWIKASVTEHILRSWSLVKLGTMAAQKKLFFSLRKAKARLQILDAGELDPEQAEALSKQFGLSADDILNMNRRMSARDYSLNAPVSEDGDSVEFMDTLVDESPSPEAIVAQREEAGIRNEMLQAALAELPERERHIFVERRLRDDPVTLEQLGEEYGISRERVRQLEVRAFEKVQKAVIQSARAV
ncbi:MAG: RNA polymerase sigma factor RpoH [Rhodospirillales bacterium]|nr:RNA polymerase sigma factor RpoH [Rhodospirillales bacterium]